MMDMYVVLPLVAFLISLLGTRLVILSQRKRAAFAPQPRLRGPSITRVPTGGGFAVMIALIICLLVADIDYRVILSVTLLMAVSLLHDIISVPLFVRLLVHIMAVFISLTIFHPNLLGLNLPPLLDTVLVAGAWLTFINIFADMDRIDGLSGVEMISIGTGAAMIAIFLGAFPTELSVHGMIIAAAGGGFMWWSWHPAKITLGSVGSVPAGFLLGYLLVMMIDSGYYYASAILPAYYLTDSLLTWGMRKRKRTAVDGTRHSSYFIVAALHGGRSHNAVSCYVAGVNMLCGGLAVYSVLFPYLAPYTLIAAYVAVGLLLAFFAYTKHNPQHELF